MTDVNYVEYANNGLRLVDQGETLSSFLATNGSEIGALIGIMVVLLIFIGIVLFLFTRLSKLRGH